MEDNYEIELTSFGWRDKYGIECSTDRECDECTEESVDESDSDKD